MLNLVFCPRSAGCSVADLVTRVKAVCEDKEVNVDVVENTCYVGLLDYALHVCRSRGFFRRKLLLTPADLDFVLRILLQQANKDLTGDSTHTRSELIELENWVRKSRGQGAWPDAEDGSGTHTVVRAATAYKKYLADCNLVDSWAVWETLRQILGSSRSDGDDTAAAGCATFHVLVLKRLEAEECTMAESLGLASAQRLEIIEGHSRFTNIAISDCAIVTEGAGEKEEIEEKEEEDCSIFSNLDCRGVQIWLGLMRLMANSRDEVCLARVLTLTSLVTGGQCQAVRQESRRVGLPMYQTIVSYITQASLGGKSYAPDEKHPFAELGSSLGDLVRLMERLQTRLEETASPVEAVNKVTANITAWLVKRGVSFSTDLIAISSQIVEEVKRRQESLSATPGRGVVGRPAIRLITGLADRVACWPVRLESAAVRAAKTPARHKSLLAFFHTPQLDTDPAVEDELDLVVAKETVGERLGISAGPSTPAGRPAAAYPRYQSSLAWAVANSPVGAASPALTSGPVAGCTLVAAASSSASPLTSKFSNVKENALRILQELKEDQEKEAKEAENLLATKVKDKTKPKPAKRCLAQEVDEAVREKLGLPSKKKKSEPSENAKPKLKATKKCPTPKGQKKMTAFFKTC